MEVMLDLETLGNKPGCVVLSIGAAAFDLNTGLSYGTFHAHLEVAPQLATGLQVDAGTIEWWMDQSDAARTALKAAHKVIPHTAIGDFRQWFYNVGGEGVWGHGLSFDIPILEAVMIKCGSSAPWKYSAGRDTRTLFALAGKKMGDFGTPNPLAHDALQDAIYQAKETAACWQYVKGGMK